MRLGLNTFHSRQRPWGDLGPAYFRQAAHAIRLVQPGTQVVVVGDADRLAGYAGCEVLEAPAPSGGLGGLLRGDRALIDAITQAGFDALLSPLDAPLGIANLPEVLYALDAAPWEPEPGAPPGRGRKIDAGMSKICSRARTILVPSEHLRRRCAALFEAPLDRFAVAPPGVSPGFQTRQRSLVEAPYLVVLVDALTAPHLPRLREALVTLQKELPHTFVVTGPPLDAEGPDDWGPRTVRVEQCPDVHLAGLYQHAAMVIYPALHDGCGVRLLEAMGAGVPVVAPKSGAFMEVAGDAPLYYNPDSTGSMLQAVRRMATEKAEQREQRIRLGQKHAAAQNTWDKCAWKILNALRRG
jgi:glycosyltransferase involved in cell wall biosynthesis